MKNINSAAGFSLIEVTIALTIMATLTVLSSQSIQQAIKSKIKLQDQVGDMSKVRDSLRVIERDINLAYHYRDLELEFEAEVRKKSKTTPGTPMAPGSPQTPPDDIDNFFANPETREKYKNRKDPTTQFIGKENAMDFTTMNTGRVTDTQLMADFVNIGYSLEACQKLSGEGSAGQCLVRRLAPIAEGDVTKGGEKTVLLENVSEFKLRYFGKGKQDWNTDWSSLGNDGVAKGNFPQAVEISLAIEVDRGTALGAGGKKKVSMQLVAGVRYPNNKENRNAPGVRR